MQRPNIYLERKLVCVVRLNFGALNSFTNKAKRSRLGFGQQKYISKVITKASSKVVSQFFGSRDAWRTHKKLSSKTVFNNIIKTFFINGLFWFRTTAYDDADKLNKIERQAKILLKTFFSLFQRLKTKLDVSEPARQIQNGNSDQLKRDSKTGRDFEFQNCMLDGWYHSFIGCKSVPVGALKDQN